MTFQNSKTSSAPKFKIIIEEQKVYFSDYPDFPIFNKAIFPEQLWIQTELQFDELVTYCLNYKDSIEALHFMLQVQFLKLHSTNEREDFIDSILKKAKYAFDKCTELEHSACTDQTIKSEIAYTDIETWKQFNKMDTLNFQILHDYHALGEFLLWKAVCNHGFDVDLESGEIKELTAALSQETHP